MIIHTKKLEALYIHLQLFSHTDTIFFQTYYKIDYDYIIIYLHTPSLDFFSITFPFSAATHF